LNITGRKWEIGALKESAKFWESCAKRAYSKKLKTEERLCLQHATAQKKIMAFLKGKNDKARERKA